MAKDINTILIETNKLNTPIIQNNGLIYDAQLIPNLNKTISSGDRSKFSLLLSMLSPSIDEQLPIFDISEKDITENILREKLQLPQPQPLRSQSDSYPKSALISTNFHQNGILAAKLQAELLPDALVYLPENTCDFPERTFHNLSFHDKRHLLESKNKDFEKRTLTETPSKLYNNLVKDNLISIAA